MEQSFFSQRLVFTTRFFHNEFGRQIEYVGLDLVPELLPSLTPLNRKCWNSSCRQAEPMS